MTLTSSRASLRAKRSVIQIALFVLTAIPSFAQRPTPAPPQSKSILIKGGTVHVGDGTSIDDAAVGFRNGVIDYVGHSYGVTATYDTTIVGTGHDIYPGFILADNSLGLQEIDLVRATADVNEIGDLEPEARALPAFNTDSKIIPTVRDNGVLIVQSTPRGGTICGTSSIMQLDAWDWESALVKKDDGVHLNWPRAYKREGWWAEPGATSKEKSDERAKKLDALHQFFVKAKAYAQVSKPDVVDLRMEAMRGLFDGSKTLFVNADLAKEIQEAVLFAYDLDVKRTVIIGGYDAWRVADLLRDKKVDVVLRRVHSLPLRDDDDIDLPYRLPSMLKEKGIRFCLSYEGDMERMGSRNLGFTAGTACTFGLKREEALQAITLDAARILGIDARYGSLGVGKSATLFISTGDALNMKTCNVVHAFIDGRRIDLDNSQKKLWRQYEQRYSKP